MSNIISAGVLCRLVWKRGTADHAVNVLHYAWPPAGVVNAATAGEMALAISTSLTNSGLKAELASPISLDRVGLRDRRAANQPLIESPAPNAGTAVGDELPPDTSLVVTLRTPLAGRGFRGRVFLCGFAETANGPGGIATPAAVTAAQAFIAGIMSIPVTGGTADLAVAHQFSQGVPLEPGTLQVVSQAVVRDNVWDRQKRRATPGI